ncbi:MAG: hypothetical protein ACRDT8_24775, partial [Micromonosporaceae bacterium]
MPPSSPPGWAGLSCAGSYAMIDATMRFVLDEKTRLGLALDSLAGVSVGDALGAQYFMVGRRAADLLAG